MNVRVLAIGIALAFAASHVRAEMISRPKGGTERVSGSKACRVELRGEPLKATLFRDADRAGEVNGVGEVSWVGDTLIYSVGPVHGKSGIYAWRCSGGTPRVIVKPTKITTAHPDGADLFKLVEIQGQMLRYAHAPDVDSPTLERDLERRRKTLSLRPYVEKPAPEKR